MTKKTEQRAAGGSSGVDKNSAPCYLNLMLH